MPLMNISPQKHQNILILEKLNCLMSIYALMKKNWKTYCLLSAITYIEEMSKPSPHIQIKKYKNKIYHCKCFSSIELRMKDKEFIEKYFEITKFWERKKNKIFIGPSFSSIKIDNRSGQYKFLLTPTWLSNILSVSGNIPNNYTLEKSIVRIEAIKQKRNEKKNVNIEKNLFNQLFENKKLAAGTFIVSMDLEFRGIQNGVPSLCMSEKYRDFLEFMLKVAQKWNWTKNKELSPVKVEYSRNLGINASPQYEFRINIKGLQEIHRLAGPLAISEKEKCIKFHVDRSRNYKNLGGKFKNSGTKERILQQVMKNKNLSSTVLQFTAGVGIDVVLDHLHSLENQGKIIKERQGKRYIWNIK
jgi:hypothetical protein